MKKKCLIFLASLLLITSLPLHRAKAKEEYVWKKYELLEFYTLKLENYVAKPYGVRHLNKIQGKENLPNLQQAKIWDSHTGNVVEIDTGVDHFKKHEYVSFDEKVIFRSSQIIHRNYELVKSGTGIVAVDHDRYPHVYIETSMLSPSYQGLENYNKSSNDIKLIIAKTDQGMIWTLAKPSYFNSEDFKENHYPRGYGYVDEKKVYLPGAYQGKVVSDDPNAYPDDGAKDGDYYKKISDKEAIHKIHPSDIIPEEIQVGGVIDITDNIKNLPKDSIIQDVTKPAIDTKKEGNYIAAAEVTLPTGHILEVPIPVIVGKKRPRIIDQVLTEVVKTGQAINLTDNIVQTDAIKSVEELVKPDPKSLGSCQGKVRVLFQDGHVEEVLVPIYIYNDFLKENGLLKEELEKLRDQLEEALKGQKDSSSLLDRIKDLEKERDQFKEEIEKLEKELAEKDQRRVDLEDLKNKIVELEKKLKEAEEAKKKLEEKLAQKEDPTSQDEKIQKLEDLIKDLKEKLKEFDGKVPTDPSTIKDFEEKIKKMEEEKKKLEEELKDRPKKEDLEEKNIEIQDLIEKLNQLEEKIKELEKKDSHPDQGKDFEKKIKELEDALKKKEEEIAQLRDALKEKDDLINKLKEDLADKDKIEEEKNRLADTLEALKKDHEDIKKKLDKILEKLLDAIDPKEKEKLEEDKKDLQNRNDELKDKIKDLEKKIEDLKKEGEKKDQSIQDLEDKLKDKDKRIEDHLKEKEKLEDKIEDLEDKVKESDYKDKKAKEELDQAKKDFKDWKKKFGDLLEEYKDEKKKNKKLEEELEKLKQLLKESEEGKKDLEDQLENKKKEFEEVKDKLQEKDEKIKELEKVKDKILEEKKKFQEEAKKDKKRIQELEKEKENLIKELEDLQKELEAYKEAIERIKETIKELEDATLIKEVEEQEEKLTDQEKDLDSILSELEEKEVEEDTKDKDQGKDNQEEHRVIIVSQDDPKDHQHLAEAVEEKADVSSRGPKLPIIPKKEEEEDDIIEIGEERVLNPKEGKSVQDRKSLKAPKTGDHMLVFFVVFSLGFVGFVLIQVKKRRSIRK